MIESKNISEETDCKNQNDSHDLCSNSNMSRVETFDTFIFDPMQHVTFRM